MFSTLGLEVCFDVIITVKIGRDESVSNLLTMTRTEAEKGDLSHQIRYLNSFLTEEHHSHS